jgi:heme exporter protein CcmB
MFACRSAWRWLFLVMLLGTWGITVIGTMFSAMTVNLRLRELMLPTLIYPMLIPGLMGAIELSRVLITGGSAGREVCFGSAFWWRSTSSSPFCLWLW